ncbi:MAG TPA: ABC transporter permease, partial [Bryobacteraceae bacterium]
AAEKIQRGMKPEDALREARQELGGSEQVKESVRDTRMGRSFDTLLQDLRYGLRMLVKHRSFTSVTILTLALGIGACTAIFSLVNAVLIHSLPYGNAQRLVYLWGENSRFHMGAGGIGLHTADFFDLKNRSHSFANMTLFLPTTYNVTVKGEQTQRVWAARVGKDFFSTLQSAPEFGRVFNAGDEQPNNNHVAVIGYALWQGMFGGRADILGRAVRLDGSLYRIVGVMPRAFGFPHSSDFPRRYERNQAAQLWVPSALSPREKANRLAVDGIVLARLMRGVTLQQAEAETRTAVARFDLLRIPPARGWSAVVQPFLNTAIGPVRPLMWLLLGGVSFVLLIACANAANLLLARAVNRAHELGMRAALGAGRGRLLRQMLTESLMLSAAAGGVGIGLAYLFLHALLTLNPGDIPRMQDAALNLRVLAFLVAISVVTGIVFGILPSLAAARVNLAEFLKTGGIRGIVGGRKLMKNALVVVQVALTVVLLTGTGLLLQSYINVLSAPTGFSSSTIAANIQLSGGFYANQMNPRYNSAQKQQTFFRELLDKLKPIPGIQAAGLINALPLSNSGGMTLLQIEGQPGSNHRLVQARTITAGYLSAMQIPLLKGRNFNKDDRSGQPTVALVNEAFAKTYFPNGVAIGRHIRGNPTLPWTTIVGITGNVRTKKLDAAPPPQIYRCFWQTQVLTPLANDYISIRSSLPKAVIISEVRAAVRSLDPNVAVSGIDQMGDRVTEATARRRFQTTLLTVFSAIAMFLAIVGVYGVLAYSVRQRWAEIGIRMALGSSRISVVRLVLREGLVLVGIGVLIGSAVALASTRLLSGFLYHVPALDPITFTLVPVFLFVAASVACLVPSYRASTIDPMSILRHE